MYFSYRTQILKYFPQVQKYSFRTIKFLKECFIFLTYIRGSSLHSGPPPGIHLNTHSYNKITKNRYLSINTLLLGEELEFQRTLPSINSKLVKEKFKNFLKTKIVKKEGFILYSARYLSGHGGTITTADDKIFIPCSPLRNECYPDRINHYIV